MWRMSRRRKRRRITFLAAILTLSHPWQWTCLEGNFNVLLHHRQHNISVTLCTGRTFFPTKNSRIYYLVDASCLCVWCLIDFQCQWWWWPRNATTTTTTMTTKKIIIGDWEEWEIERWTWTSECFYPSISHSRLLSGVFGDFNFFTVTRWPAFPLAIALPVTRCLSNVPFVSHIQYFFVCLCRMVVVVVVVYRHSANTLTNQINVFNWEKRDNKSLFTNVMIKERE